MIYSDEVIEKISKGLTDAQREHVENEVQEELMIHKLLIMDNYENSFKACSKLYHICINKISDLEESLNFHEEQRQFSNTQYYLNRTVYLIKCYDDARILYKKMAEDLYKNLKETK